MTAIAINGKAGDAIMAAIGDIEKGSSGVMMNLSAGVFTLKSIRQRGEHLKGR